MRTSAEERLVTQAGPSRASLFSLTLTGVLVLGRLEMIPARKVTITLGRGLDKARYEYLWEVLLESVDNLECSGEDGDDDTGKRTGQARYEYLWVSSWRVSTAWSLPRHQSDSSVDLGVILVKKSFQPWLSTPGIIVESTSGMVKPWVDPDPVFRSSTPGKLLLRLVKTLAKTKVRLLTPGKFFFRLASVKVSTPGKLFFRPASLCLGSDTIFRLLQSAGTCRDFVNPWPKPA